MQDRSTARALAWTALSGLVAFLVAWIVAGIVEPRYSPFRRGFSELAARGAAHPWIAMAGTAALALAIAVVGLALRRLLPPGRATVAVAILFAAAAVALVLTAGGLARRG